MHSSTSNQGRRRIRVAAAGALLAATALAAQQTPPAETTPAPELQQRPGPTTPRLPRMPLRGFTEPDEPAHPDPPTARPFSDSKYNVSFTVPAGWNLEKKDGLLSNFGVDTRTARRRTDVRGVAAMNFNPWPVSTFASAIFYYSVIPRANAGQCAAQVATQGVKLLPDTPIDGTPFHHGRDQHGKVCTEARDEVFTAMQGSACLRFDLVVNTFCAETSGAMEITPTQLQDVDRRLALLLGSVTLGNGKHGDAARN